MAVGPRPDGAKRTQIRKNKMQNQQAIDELRWKKFPVLSDGFVTLVDVMGDDSSITQAARVSYGRDARMDQVEGGSGLPYWTQSQKSLDEDRTLLRYLMRHRHSTPFEMAEVKILVRVPMDCWRQWIRHRTANVNEYSTRYTEAIDSMDQTLPDAWRLQSGANKQGSSGMLEEWPEGYVIERWDAGSSEAQTPVSYKGRRIISGVSVDALKEDPNDPVGWVVNFVAPDGTVVRKAEFPHRKRSEITSGLYLSSWEQLKQEESQSIYQERLAFGVAREQARKDLPLSTYTEAYWKCDLHNILGFLALRMDSHAQLEIRQYATIIGELIIKPLFPMVWEAFEDYRLGAMVLTRLEIEVIKNVVGYRGDPIRYSSEQDLPGLRNLVPDEWLKEKCRERDECIEKLKRLGLIA